jgi:hypothetical protein
MTPELVVALLSLVGTCVGSIAGILTANRLTNYKIDQLTARVDKHNCLIDRTYKLETRVTVLEEKED